MIVSGVAHLEVMQPAAIFYLFGYPTPYAYERMYNIGKTGEISDGAQF
jgi:hypothetical protein